jgi:hypothetical protein
VSRLLRSLLYAGLFAAVLPWSTPVAAQPAAPAADSPERLTRIARLLAGVEPAPGDPVIDQLVAGKAWQQHREASRRGFALLRTRLDRMTAWSHANVELPAGGGQTLVYPFSGPDLVNAVALFPDHDTYVFFSLEPVGSVPAVAALPPARFAALLADLRTALNDIVNLNFFITPNMEKRMHTPALNGVTPVLLSMLGLMDLDVLSVEQVDLWPERSAALARPGARRPAQPLQTVRIDFRDPRRGRVQHLLYLSFDVSDKALAAYPEFAPWLDHFDRPTVFMKSASYLLHLGGFDTVGRFVATRAALVVQDDTGMPYRRLKEAGFNITLYGQYEQPVKLFERRYQKDLAADYAVLPKTTPVPFPFGYNWRKDGRSFVIVARRPAAG